MSIQITPKNDNHQIRNSTKRTLTDYFKVSDTQPPPSKARRLDNNNTNESHLIIPSKTSSVPGLTIIPNFITAPEESQLLTFLSTQNWRTDLSRRVIHYGGTYCHMAPRNSTPEERKQIESKIYTADPIPDAFSSLLSRMAENPHNLYTTSTIPEYCIVNEYTGNNGISAHVENFRFGSPVCGLTMGDGDWMRFHELTVPDDGSVRTGKAAKAERTGRKVDVWMPPRGLVVMSGEAREKWQHGIVRGKKGRVGIGWKRTSLTFRTLRAGR